MTMTDFFPLQALYQRQLAGCSEISPLDHQVQALLQNRPVELKDLIDKCQWDLSPEVALDNWKYLLTLNLLDAAHVYVNELAAKIYHYEQQAWNHHSQYSRALVALNHLLAKLPVPEVGVCLLQSGAALVDLQEYAPWSTLPYIPQQLEFGIFLCTLAHLGGAQHLHESILRLAQWLLLTLDSDGNPLNSLFVRECEGNHFTLLALHALFWRAVSVTTGEAKFAQVAQLVNDHLEKTIKTTDHIEPWWVLCERVFPKTLKETPHHFTFSPSICDSSTALIGYRTAQQSTICTLHGGHTGLGSMRFRDVTLLNYGPQHLPLSDCSGFGIEGNHLSDHGIRQSIMENRSYGFSLKGCVRLVDRPPQFLHETVPFCGIWLEIAQEFKLPQLRLTTTVLSLDEWNDVAFSFFVQAKRCKVQSGPVLTPGTLERYEGLAHPLLLEGEHASLSLYAKNFQGTLQVIPLAGKNDYWGAHFLVAYLLTPQQKHYEWFIEPVSNL